jgi:hypothetical protein
MDANKVGTLEPRLTPEQAAKMLNVSTSYSLQSSLCWTHNPLCRDRIGRAARVQAGSPHNLASERSLRLAR